MAGLAGLFVYRKELSLVALLLFTRLVQPRLLDHATRARMVEAVAADPGVTASGLAARLRLPRGVALHHLYVLERERLLSSVRADGFRHYFPAGRFSPRDMRQRAVLRQSHAADLYRLVLAQPGIEVGAAASRVGIAPSQASHLVDRLSREGLIERLRGGRTVQLRAVRAA
ncbi:MAG: helix-turn-helix domain-containing protein [Euryarchaeota archaeon]|nr:helix-turn-helix domain-containing protein [Euryarchaeota archaeon]